MKKTLSKLIAVIGFFVAMVATAEPVFIHGSYTDGVAPIAPTVLTSNVFLYSGTIDVRKTEWLYLEQQCGYSAAGTNMVFNWVTSTDGITWATNDIFFSSVCNYHAAGMGNTTGTNVQTKGVGYIKLFSTGNNYDADSTISNVLIRYSYTIPSK